MVSCTGPFKALGPWEASGSLTLRLMTEQRATSPWPTLAHQGWVSRQEEGLVWWKVRGGHPRRGLARVLAGTSVDPTGRAQPWLGASHGQAHLPPTWFLFSP